MKLPDQSTVRAATMLLATVAPLLGMSMASAQEKKPQEAYKPVIDRTAYGEEASLEPRRIAAAIVASDFPTPHMVVQVGASTGAMLETFMEKLPTAHGEWVEAITSEHNLPLAHSRLDHFGDRVEFKFGCARRDLGPGCNLPKDTDVILIDWLSIQQPLDQIYRIYKAGADKLPPGGWIVDLDHVSFSGSSWEPLIKTAAKGFRPEQEGPPVHYPQFGVPTAQEQLAAMKAAGLDAQVVWQSFTTALIMGRKK